MEFIHAYLAQSSFTSIKVKSNLNNLANLNNMKNSKLNGPVMIPFKTGTVQYLSS